MGGGVGVVQATKEWDHFYWGVDPSRHFVKIFVWQLEEGWVDEMVKKWDRKRFYISCNYSCTISFLVKILLVKLKLLLYSVCLNLIIKKWNSNQNVKVEKMIVFVTTFDHYHHKFNFGNFFSCPVKL